MTFALVDQAFASSVVGGGLACDLVFANGVWSEWTGSDYQHRVGNYDPPTSEAHLICEHFPAGVAPVTLAGSNELAGLYQVIIRTPSVDGGFVNRTKLDAVRALLHAGKKISYSGQAVNITTNNVLYSRVQDEWLQTTFRANYVAYVNR